MAEAGARWAAWEAWPRWARCYRLCRKSCKDKGKDSREAARVAGKGGNKPVDPKKEALKKSMEKLKKFEAEQKVWIAGLKPSVTWKQLEKHAVDTCGTKPKVSEVTGKGKGVLAFATADEATTAIAIMNGSELAGDVIEADVWTQKERTPKTETEDGEKPKRKEKTKEQKKAKEQRRLERRKAEKTTDPGKMLAEKINAVDAENKVWVGELSPDTSTGKIKQHFISKGCKGVNLVKTMKKGTAVVTFKTADDATTAIAICNGTDLDGQTIVADVWVKADPAERAARRAEKKAKTE